MDLKQSAQQAVTRYSRSIRERAAEQFAVAKTLLAGDTQQLDLHRIFSHVDDRSWLGMNTYGYRRNAVLRRILPSMPDPELQKYFVGGSGDATLKEGFGAYRTVKELMARYGRPIGPDSSVLDFGCGWGRIIRFFLRDVPGSQLWGADVLPRAIEVCKETNPYCTFVLGQSLPPSDLPSDKFDVVYMYSVFSHLNEEATNAWLSEFHRVLRPGGMLIATTWHRDYLEWCDRARKGDTRHTHPGSLLAFEGDPREWQARYDRGEFCHTATGGGDGLEPTFYGETCIPEGYVRKHWADRFQIREFIVADHVRYHQNVIAIQKR